MSWLSSVSQLGGLSLNQTGKMGGGPASADAGMKALQDAMKGASTQGANPTEILERIGAPGETTSVRPAGNSDFGGVLKEAVDQVEQAGKAASRNVEDVMLGRSDNIHQAMISVGEAGVAFSLMIEVRNKMVDTYHELMRMQV